MIILNGKPLDFSSTYPNGEVVPPPIESKAGHLPDMVELDWRGDHDLLHLALVRGALAQQVQERPPGLLIWYMPYERMDRAGESGATVSLRWVAEAIREMGWDSIGVVEPHSEETLRHLGRGSSAVWGAQTLLPKAMQYVGFEPERDFVVLPDAGALRRYEGLPFFRQVKSGNVIEMKKVRTFDPTQGGSSRINSIAVDRVVMHGGHRGEEGRQAIILDDLCSRGGTFVGAAKALRGFLGIDKVHLVVTHMEAAGLTGDLRTALDRVFVSNTMPVGGADRPLPDNFTLTQRGDLL